MPQVSGVSPFEECHLTDQLRFDPVAFLHLFRSQRLAPSRDPFLGQVFDWRLWMGDRMNMGDQEREVASATSTGTTGSMEDDHDQAPGVKTL